MIQARTLAALVPKAATVKHVGAKIARAVGTAQNIAQGMGGRSPMGMSRLAYAGHGGPGGNDQHRPPGHTANDLVQEIANLANRSGHSDPAEARARTSPPDPHYIDF